MDLLNASRNYEVFHDGAVGLVRVQVRSVYASDVYSVARFCLINEVILEYDSYRPGELAGGRPFWHLLEDDLLVVAVDAIAVLGGERAALRVGD